MTTQAEIHRKAWATRRAKYGPSGQTDPRLNWFAYHAHTMLAYEWLNALRRSELERFTLYVGDGKYVQIEPYYR